MKQITIISGKGGTGKTTITASFAALAHNPVIVDCDVDAADLHLLLHPLIRSKQEFRGSKEAVIDEEKCIDCRLCEGVCRFDAIDGHTIDPILCEGCGVCAYVCPENAITLREKISGYAFISETEYGPMVHARLNIAEEASGKLVSLVRNEARKIAEGRDLILIDGPPGIGCPVIASLSGVDRAVIVTEPTMSGIHDLERILGMARHFGIASLVCINKYDLNEENTNRILGFCQINDVNVVGKILYDPIVTKAMIAGKPIVEFSGGQVSREIKKMWINIERSLK
ncbi:MAG: ATP-binding protein [Methanocellales archaeon]|nr:ATP-binding protein [Methanocellales archaeon]MDD3421240.1 ATP-binding protein [Methanocellales archaeon]MDD4898403.1 ATP-binding protein [Methanocellales archaeon]MDD5447015.1 ATP-binding protein [Methanocellales archaeon]